MVFLGLGGAGAPLDPLLLPPLVVCELEELRSRPVLLGACKLCPTLRSELDEKNALIKSLGKLRSWSLAHLLIVIFALV